MLMGESMLRSGIPLLHEIHTGAYFSFVLTVEPCSNDYQGNQSTVFCLEESVITNPSEKPRIYSWLFLKTAGVAKSQWEGP